MERLTVAERTVLLLILFGITLVAAWQYWRTHEITRSTPESAIPAAAAE